MGTDGQVCPPSPFTATFRNHPKAPGEGLCAKMNSAAERPKMRSVRIIDIPSWKKTLAITETNQSPYVVRVAAALGLKYFKLKTICRGLPPNGN
jgi:hypothetical protein